MIPNELRAAMQRTPGVIEQTVKMACEVSVQASKVRDEVNARVNAIMGPQPESTGKLADGIEKQSGHINEINAMLHQIQNYLTEIARQTARL